MTLGTGIPQWVHPIGEQPDASQSPLLGHDVSVFQISGQGQRPLTC